MFGQVNHTAGGMSNGGATTVYPPQPYAPTGHQMGSNQPGTSVMNQTHPSPSMKPAGNLQQDPGMSTNAAVVNATRNHINGGTPSRKRTASASPSMEAKEKKTRNEIGGGASPAGTRPASVNGIRPDQHRQGSEEASKLDVYVWDYLTRRGFNNTAKILQNEARLGDSPDVALKTPQGLLYEYWAVFWEGLAARSGRGNIDANAFPDKTQRINEIVRRTEAMESGTNVTDNLQRLASGIVGGALKQEAGQPAAAGQMFGQVQQAQRVNMNGQQINTPQQQPQALQQQQQQQQQPQARTPVQTPGGTPIPMQQGQMAGWNANPGTAVQQQTQMLIMAAQRHNISLDELKNMNPTMRNALIQSVTGGNQQNQVGGAATGAQNMRPGMTPGAAVASAAATAMNASSPFDQSMHQRMQQFQQQQTQQQRNATQGGIRPGMMGGPQSGPGTPGAAGTPTMNGQGGMDSQQRPAGQIPGQPGMATPQMHPQTPQTNQHVQTPGGQAAGGPNNGSARPMQPGQVAGTPGNVSGPMAGQEASMHPRLTTEQQQMLMTQHQTLQQTLRQEVYHAQHAPTPAIAERSFQNAQQIQMRLGQLSALLKAQPGLQQQAALFQQQQHQHQQQQQQQVAAQQQMQQLQQQQAAASAGRPGMPPGMQAGLHGIPSGFPPGLTPQQQQQFLAQRAAMQNRPPQGDQNMMMNMMTAHVRPSPQQQQQQQQKKTPQQQQQQQFNNAGVMSMEAARQQQLQQQIQQQQIQQFHQQQHAAQQSQQNAQGAEVAGTPGSENQPRTPFAFANPFAATAGARSQSQSQSDDPGHPQSAGLPGSFQQIPPNHQMGAPGQRPMSSANRMGTGMGPPQNISSPSPRMQQNNMLTEGSVTGSPAQIPSTPKTANAPTPASQSAAEKKKKEPARGRKNSKAVNNNANANKTPILGAATTPSTQVQTPAGNNNMPTPGRDSKATNANTPATASSTALNANIIAPVGPASSAMAGMMSMPPNAFEQNSAGNGLQSSALNNNNSNNTNTSAASSTTTAPSNTTNATLTSSASTSATSAANNTANVPSNIGTDDLSQMFNSGDMSQFLNDFDFPSGGAFSSGDGSGLGAFGDSWDTSNLGNLFGDTLS